MWSLLAGAAHAGDSGWFGLALNIDAGGSWLSPVVESATVQRVMPGSPAAAAHLSPGDVLLEVEGMAVVHGDGGELKRRMHKLPGEVLHLRLRHADGAEYTAELIAAPRPDAH